MRIGILLHPYDEDKPAGLGRYIFELSKYLIEADRANEYILFIKKKPRKLPPIGGNNWSVEILDNSPLWLGWSFRGAARADVYIFNTPVLPLLLPKGKSVVIALDFAYRHLPAANLRDFLKKHALSWYHGYSIKRANHVISISQTTKKEVMKMYRIPQEKISVVYPGFNKICELPEERAETPEKFFLFVGVLKDRKNPLTVVKAFVQFLKRHPDYKLVMAGKGGGPYYEEMQEYVRTHGAEDAVLFVGFITDNQLSYLYKRAYAFVFPSILEGGFCLPVLEAMSCGVPVITSGQGPFESMEETTGDAAILVNPLDAQEIAEAMERVVEVGGVREDLIQKGFERAKKFSWEGSAQGMLRVIRHVYGNV